MALRGNDAPEENKDKMLQFLLFCSAARMLSYKENFEPFPSWFLLSFCDLPIDIGLA